MTIILSLLLGLASFAQDEKVITLKDRSQIYAISSITQESDSPTFIFLPGIYRGYYKDESFLGRLSARKINWIAMHFSRHPESVLAGSPVWLMPTSSSQLAHEVLQVKRAFKIKKPIVVSLSYSTSIVPYLDTREFPVVVETAPMGRADESLPPEKQFPVSEQWMSFFPIWNSWMKISADYWSYRYYWMKMVQEKLLPQYPHYQKQQYLIAEGLAQLGFASRDFDLREQNFESGPKRYWILGQNENAVRKKIQLEAIGHYRRFNPAPGENNVFIVPSASHIIPVDQPEAYTQILVEILKSVAR